MGSTESGDASGSASVVVAGPAAVVEVRGEVDIATCPQIDDTIATASRGAVEALTLDLGGVTFMGSSGLATLLRAQRRAEEAGGRLVLARVSRPVRDLLVMTHLTDRFELVDTPSDED